MKTSSHLVFSVAAAALLSSCAGPAPKPAAAAAKAAPTATPPPPAPAKPVVPKFYIITFDAQGIAHDRMGVAVSRERALQLIQKGEIDRHTGIRIEVPKGITDRDKSIEAFARAQQIAKIFDLLGFEAVVVVLPN